MSTRIIIGDALSVLRGMDAGSVRCCVTSPPYWGLRDYGVAGQLGLEKSPAEYVAAMVAVFAEVRRVLTKDGTLWLNLGDSYNSIGHKKSHSGFGTTGLAGGVAQEHSPTRRENAAPGLKHKDLVGIPWRVAFALQDDGWWLREDIIWAKKNGMPESVTDRCTRSHEYVFHLAKSARYYHDAEAIAEPCANGLAAPDANGSTISGGAYGRHALGEAIPEKQRRTDKQRGHSRRHAGFNDRWDAMEKAEQCAGTRNARSVWFIATHPFPEAHFATFPPELPRRCILAGSRVGDTVLDPFAGAGTTLLVADRLQRHGVGIELNPKYAAMAERRIRDDAPLFASNE